MGEVFLCAGILNLPEILTYFDMNQVKSALRSNLCRGFALALFPFHHNPSVTCSNIDASWLISHQILNSHHYVKDPLPMTENHQMLFIFFFS